MIWLSLFNGMNCGRIAAELQGLPVTKYYSSEIDKYANKITDTLYPDTIQLGSITEWKSWNIEQPDIIIGGSPCQGFSFAGKQLNFEDERSKLFFVFVEILKHYKPKYFLLENVVMKAEYNDVISRILGELYPEHIDQGELFQAPRLEPIKINSALVSAQNRERLYWTNIPGIKQPKDRGILLKDIIESCPDVKFNLSQGEIQYMQNGNEKWQQAGNCRFDRYSMKPDDKAFTVTANIAKGVPYNCLEITGGAIRGRNPDNPKSRVAGLPTKQMLEIKEDGKDNCLTSVGKDSLCIQIGKADLNGHDYVKRVYSPEGKSPNLCTGTGGNLEPKISEDNISWRKLTPRECGRLQTVPEEILDKMLNSGVSNSQLYKMFGNGWTIEVIRHIFSFIKS